MTTANKFDKKVYKMACKAGFPHVKVPVGKAAEMYAKAWAMVFNSKSKNPFN